MRIRFKLLVFSAAVTLALIAGAAGQALVLRRVAKVGDVAKYRMKADMEYQGMPVTFTGLITEKVTKVTPDGQYTVEAKTTEGKVSMGGTAVDSGDSNSGATTTTFKSTGEVVTIISDQSDPNLYRMANLQSIQFSTDPVKVGDAWEVKVAKDDRGAVDAKGTFKVEAQEKVGDYDTLRIHGTIKESADRNPAAVDATYWVSTKDGSVVKLVGTWTNTPFPPPFDGVTARLTLYREG